MEFEFKMREIDWVKNRTVNLIKYGDPYFIVDYTIRNQIDEFLKTGEYLAASTITVQNKGFCLYSSKTPFTSLSSMNLGMQVFNGDDLPRLLEEVRIGNTYLLKATLL